MRWKQIISSEDAVSMVCSGINQDTRQVLKNTHYKKINEIKESAIFFY
jgi:hypothetical protein